MSVFGDIKDSLRRAAEERERAAQESRARAQAEARQQQEYERRVEAVKIFTGGIKHRYAVLDTLRAFAHYSPEPGTAYDPTASVRQAVRLIQEQAVALGANAVIYGQYQMLRYTVTRNGYHDVPVYETHLFGTAVKIIGPPTDWPEE